MNIFEDYFDDDLDIIVKDNVEYIHSKLFDGQLVYEAPNGVIYESYESYKLLNRLN